MKRPSAADGIAQIKDLIRDVPDFPKPGIVFKDITPLLADAEAFKSLIELMAAPYKGKGIEQIAGIESRGFLLATAMAYHLGAGVIPIRKKGKLPRKTISVSYALEYGTDTVEAHADAARSGSKILLVDDVLATGGTASASLQLLEQLGARVVGASFLIELDFLKGREKLREHAVESLIHY